MTPFITAQQLASLQHATNISTGNPQLDELTGGINPDTLTLIYSEDTLTDTLSIHLLANSLTPTQEHPQPETTYITCGNYHHEHTTLNIETITTTTENTGQHPEEALKRAHILVASSADQQANLTTELEKIINASGNTRLVIMDDLAKLGVDDARKTHRQSPG